MGEVAFKRYGDMSEDHPEVVLVTDMEAFFIDEMHRRGLAEGRAFSILANFIGVMALNHTDDPAGAVQDLSGAAQDMVRVTLSRN